MDLCAENQFTDGYLDFSVNDEFVRSDDHTFHELNTSEETVLNDNSEDLGYDCTTLSMDYTNSVDSLYDASTVYNSSLHDVSPLLAQDNLFNGKGMHIGHINIRGIRSGEKLDQIKIILHSMENNICMLGLSESKLGGEIPDSFLLIENFQCFRKDTPLGTGGLLVYVQCTKWLRV